jgi:hypothetical protein
VMKKLEMPTSEDRAYEWMTFPITEGGVGLRPAQGTAFAAYWSSIVRYLVSSFVSFIEGQLPRVGTPLAKHIDHVFTFLSKNGAARKLPPSSDPRQIRDFYLVGHHPKLQEEITRLLDRHRLSAMKPTKQEDRRLNSIVTTESCLLLTTIPTESHFVLGAPHFINAMHLRYGVGVQEDVVCACGQVIERGTSPHHFVGCNRMAHSALTTRHELVKAAIVSSYQQANAVTEADPVKPGPHICPDFTLFLSKGETCADVSVVHPLAKTHLRSPADPIAKREDKKKKRYTKYADELNRFFLPAVLDTYGKFGKGLQKIVEMLAAHAMEEQLSEDVAGNMQRRIIVQLHRGNSLAITRGFTHCARKHRIDRGAAGRMVNAHLAGNERKRDSIDLSLTPPLPPSPIAVQHNKSPSGNVQASDVEKTLEPRGEKGSESGEDSTADTRARKRRRRHSRRVRPVEESTDPPLGPED